MSCNVRNILTDTSPDRVLTISKMGRKKLPTSNPSRKTLMRSITMSIEPPKKFRNEKKPFKVMARMLKVNAMKEYSDFDLYDGTFNKKDIVKNVEDKMILCVVGKLLNVGFSNC